MVLVSTELSLLTKQTANSCSRPLHRPTPLQHVIFPISGLSSHFITITYCLDRVVTLLVGHVRAL